MDYIGYHRIGWKWAAIFIICLLIFGFGWYDAFTGTASSGRHLLDALPRPVMQALMTVIMAALIVGIPVKLHATLTGKISFAIRADGIHTYPILWQKPRFLAWNSIERAQRTRDTLIFTGYDGNGRKIALTFTPMGHRYKDIVAAIAQFHPDIAEILA